MEDRCKQMVVSYSFGFGQGAKTLYKKLPCYKSHIGPQTWLYSLEGQEDNITVHLKRNRVSGLTALICGSDRYNTAFRWMKQKAKRLPLPWQGTI
jgi:hypothetical protein